MPVQFLEQLFSTLRRDGLLLSQRGVKGGYTLARPPEEITVLEVVQALDGRVGEEASEAGGIWAEGVEALRDVFSSTTIADIARREAEEAGARHVPHLTRAACSWGTPVPRYNLVWSGRQAAYAVGFIVANMGR